MSACGNWLGDTLLYPIDTISTRLKANKHIYHHPINFAISTIKEDKFKLFKGVQLSFPAAFIPSLVYLTAYDMGMKSVSHYVHKYTHHEYIKLAFPFFVSSCAQFFALFTYLPVDVVRTRIQVIPSPILDKPTLVFIPLIPIGSCGHLEEVGDFPLLQSIKNLLCL